MKKLAIILLAVIACTANKNVYDDKLSLAGEWQFRMDTANVGAKEKWYDQVFSETVTLPGSMAGNNKGFDITLNTDWTGDIVDKSYFTEDKYEKYRQPGNIKVPFWLQPEKYYKGMAWYNREVSVPDEWLEKRITLVLERCHWQTDVYVNGVFAGSRNSLSTLNEFDLTGMFRKGRNILSVMIDNSVVIPVGVNSHSISDHTQSNWNGITGEMYLRAGNDLFISNIQVYPDLTRKIAVVVLTAARRSGMPVKGNVTVEAVSFNTGKAHKPSGKSVDFKTETGKDSIVIEYPMGKNPSLWSESDPALYSLTATLRDEKGEVADVRTVDFGMREFRTSGTNFTLNGIPVFLRGTLECCIFPLTGYPPTDEASWEKVLKACKDHGLNTIRFHSWCPPEAAFRVADRLGMFYHIECSSWANQGASIGNGNPADRFIYEEGDRIIKEYGNHPSFCMLAYGNEPAGGKQAEYLGNLLNYWKSIDNRRVFTSAAGWPVIPENQFNLIPAPRIQQWGDGLKSIINREAPNTMYDFSEKISKYDVPVVSHEIGQWCVYPDFKEIEKYTGVLKAKNFEIFRESLEEKGMGDLGEKFLMASGKLQALCYKAEVEAALRTPGFGGFHLLQLHDFPGQGTALVGVLNPFFESKGYITPEEFRMFCNATVPLARLEKHVFTNNEVFTAGIEVSHWGGEPIKNVTVLSEVKDMAGNVLKSETRQLSEISIGNCNRVGAFSMNLSEVNVPAKYKYDISIIGTSYRNSWDFWVYPQSPDLSAEDVYITDNLDSRAEKVLSGGGKVLFLPYGKVGKAHGADVAIGFSSIFWNTAWTGNQAPHTLGILCDPEHALFKSFPTEYHSNWQWWDPVTHSQAMILDDMPASIKPVIQPIDTWFENRKLSLAFEVKAGNGKLMVCSIDMKNPSSERIVTRQLLSSMLDYMNSDAFNPAVEVPFSKLSELLK